MTILDRLILLATGLIAIYMLINLIKSPRSAGKPEAGRKYYIISFAVLLTAGLLLIFFGWGILQNNTIAVVSGLIPFGIATGLVADFFPKHEKKFSVFMIIGLVLIAVARFGGIHEFDKVLYPLFHAFAFITIFAIPIYAIHKGLSHPQFILVTIGSSLIGLGGIALTFLKSGYQLLFFSQEVVLLILAPILFLMSLCFAIGFKFKALS